MSPAATAMPWLIADQAVVWTVNLVAAAPPIAAASLVTLDALHRSTAAATLADGT